MGLFGNDKKKVSEREYKEIRSRLYSKGFEADELKFLDMFLRGDLHESEELQKGIDEQEIVRAINWLRGHKDEHELLDEQIEILEEKLREYL